MLDRYTHAVVQPLLKPMVAFLVRKNAHPDKLTWLGLFVGLLCVPALALQYYKVALVCILINRIFDGLDGALARASSPSDKGGFLDITLDFIFYPAVVLGFALANPAANALSAVFLLFAFMGASCSFLAFSVMAEKNSITYPQFKNKSLYYMSGITEGTETIVFFILICLLPGWFSWLACIYGLLCLVTTAGRIYIGCQQLKS